MADFTVRFDLESLRGVKEAMRLDNRKLRQGMVLAVNDTAKHAKSHMSRKIRQFIPIKKASIDRRIKVDRAESTDNLRATVTLTDRGPLPLRAFKPRQTKHGINVRYQKGGPLAASAKTSDGRDVPLTSAFIVDSLKGHVFLRRTNKRLPIDKLFGPAVMDIVESEDVLALTAEDANEYLQKRINYRLGIALGD